jgi:anion-transporting  ArsA/GET3 family ATPase
MPPPPKDASDSVRFVIVAGKGGVGKTTVSAAQALAYAHKGKRVLIVMCNAKERISAMFGSAPVGSTVSAVADNVWAVNIDPNVALEEYGMMTLKSRSLYKLLFDNGYVRSFFRAVPGMQEWTMLGKAWWHTTEERADGTPKYDVVILDAPATGHGLDMLRVPKVIIDVVPPGLLRRDAERAWTLFQDKNTCNVIIVTLPEELPVTESIELCHALERELLLPVGKVVVNCMLPPLFSKAERAELEALDPTSSGLALPGTEALDPKASAALVAGKDRAIRERVQAEALHRLSDEIKVKTSFLPQLFGDASLPGAIRDLSKRL